MHEHTYRYTQTHRENMYYKGHTLYQRSNLLSIKAKKGEMSYKEFNYQTLLSLCPYYYLPLFLTVSGQLTSYFTSVTLTLLY